MLYNIYDHISDSDFLRNEIILKDIDDKVEKLYFNSGFYPNRSSKNSDALVLNFNSAKDGYLGNISLFSMIVNKNFHTV